MSHYQIIKPVDKPIIITSVFGELTPEMFQHICIDLSAQLEHVVGAICSIIDMTHAQVSVTSLMEIVECSRRGWPGTISDPRTISLFVGKDSNLLLGLEGLRRESVDGASRIKSFTCVADALRFAEGGFGAIPLEVSGLFGQYSELAGSEPPTLRCQAGEVDGWPVVFARIKGEVTSSHYRWMARRVWQVIGRIDDEVFLVTDLTHAFVRLSNMVDMARLMMGGRGGVSGDPRLHHLLVINPGNNFLGVSLLLYSWGAGKRFHTFLSMSKALSYLRSQIHARGPSSSF